MTALTDYEVARLLAAHTRVNYWHCTCGWEDWDQPHAHHVAQALRAAGIMLVRAEVTA